MKISIVTPSFNSVLFIRETINSVIVQKGDFEIEYIIVDGGSTDGTVDIIRKYEKEVNSRYSSRVTLHCISEPDNGMYDAINKGFSMATGDIFAWINSDDIYYSGAFQKVVDIFSYLDEVSWIIGRSNVVDEKSNVLKKGTQIFYNRDWIKKGYYGAVTIFISQESVFFRKSLWGKIGEIDTNYKLAGDYWLWNKFSEYEHIYSVDTLFAAFRRRRGQLSENLPKYFLETEKISKVNKSVFKKLHYFTKFEGHFSRTFSNFVFRQLFKRNSFYIDEEIKIKETFDFCRD